MSEGEHEILGGNVSGTLQPVLFIRMDIDYGARSHDARLPQYIDFQLALLNQHHFFMDVMMRGVGYLAGRHGCDVQVDGEAVVGCAA